MSDIDEFMTILRDGLGLAVTRPDMDLRLHDVVGWDSVHLLWLLSAMEQHTGHQVPLPKVLAAPTLASIFELYTTPAV